MDKANTNNDKTQPFGRNSMQMTMIEGIAYENKITKQLTAYIPKEKIAILHHEDIDVMAAHSLIECKVKAVINYKTSMTGQYAHDGVYRLLEAKIPVYDITDVHQTLSNINESYIRIHENRLYQLENDEWIKIATLSPYHFEKVNMLKNKAYEQFPDTFIQFAQNTLIYAQKELFDFLHRQEAMPWVEGENVLIVVRGANFEKDLLASWRKLKKYNMKVIAVDGAANILLKFGIPIDAIVGDMDSVSNEALIKSKRRYVHTYVNGKSPGEGRLKRLKLPYEKIQFIGTSEDIAILFSFWSKAKKIFLIGSHSSMNEFLEKGRRGMGSSILVRMQANDHIIDLKGYHLLEQERMSLLKYSSIPIALSFVPLAVNFGKIQMMLAILVQSFLR